MPADVLSDVQRLATKGGLIRSKMLCRSISYYRGLVKEHLPPAVHPLKSIDFHTLPISEPVPKTSRVLRFKGSPDNLDDIVIFSMKTSRHWCVDFNGSLDVELLKKTADEINFERCLFVEQPLPVGMQTAALGAILPVLVIADEELASITPTELLKRGFGGGVLKTIRHDYEDFTNWINFTQLHGLPCILGNMVCDYATLQLNNLLTSSFTWQLPPVPEGLSFLKGETFKAWVYRVEAGFLQILPLKITYTSTISISPRWLLRI